jgi:hypothetical protein
MTNLFYDLPLDVQSIIYEKIQRELFKNLKDDLIEKSKEYCTNRIEYYRNKNRLISFGMSQDRAFIIKTLKLSDMYSKYVNEYQQYIIINYTVETDMKMHKQLQKLKLIHKTYFST